MNKIFLFIPIFLFVQEIYSQEKDTMYLSLEECVTMAKKQSASLTTAHDALKNKKLSYRLSQLDILPQISLTANAPGFTRSIISVVQPDGKTMFVSQNQMSSSLNFSVTQKVPFTGGDLSLSSSVSRVDVLETEKTLYNFSPIVLSLNQPLFKTNIVRWEQKAADIEYQIAEKEFSEAVEKIAVDITAQFFESYNAQLDIENAQLNLALQDTLYKISQGRYRIGKIDENDVLQSEIALFNAKTQNISVQLQYERSLTKFKMELKIPSEKKIIFIPPQNIPLFNVDAQQALQEAKMNRSDVLKHQLQQLKNEQAITEAKLSNTFSANLQVSVGFNQRAFEVSEKTHPNIMDNQQFSIGVQIPLLQWGKRNIIIEQTLIEEKKLQETIEKEKKNFEEEITSHILQLEQSQQKIIFAQKTDTLSQRRFTVAKARYFIGKIDFNQLLIIQREKDEAQRNYQKILLEYWKEYYQLRYLTLYDFEKNESIHRTTDFLDNIK